MENFFSRENTCREGLVKMQINRTQCLIRQKRKDYGIPAPNQEFLSPTSKHLSQFNKSDIERPLNRNSEQLSFKGLSVSKALHGLKYKKVNDVAYSKKEFFDFADEYMQSAKNLYTHLEKSELSKNMMSVDKDGNIILHKKTIPHLIWDGLVYPVKILPADMLNGAVELLQKFKPLKKWADKVHERPFFKNIRQRSKHDSEMNALRGLFEVKEKYYNNPKYTKDEVKSAIHQFKLKMFNPKSGNYDTKHERALNRLVSGLPPAIFLANDAYNLSRMMDDDPKQASKEKKTRFKQETARILTSGYLTLVTLGALQKYINNSKSGIMLMTGATVLVTEMFSRLSNGKHITRLTPEEARKENLKNNAPEKDIKPTTTFKGAEIKPQTQPKEQQKPLLSVDTILKASGVVIAAGFGLKGARKLIKPLDNGIKAFQKPFKDFYKKISINPEYLMPEEKFNKIMDKLDEAGLKDEVKDFKNLVEKLKVTKEVDKKVGGNTIKEQVSFINLGAKNKGAKIVADFVIAPFKFAWNTVTLPYRYTNQLVEVVAKNFKKAPVLTEEQAAKAAEKAAKARNAKDIEALQYALDRIGKVALNGKKTPKELKDFVMDAMLKGFNVDSMSSISNSDLSNLAKTAATAATLWFLMTDNYNMVMLKSNGNDVEGAKTKFKERFVQEGSRLFYQTLLIDLFNSTFRSQYNSSLFGMSWITLTNTTLGEWLTRKSVGVPVGAHSRDELIALEDKQNNATGFLKGYYNFMQRLTGKRSVKTYEVNANTQKPVNTPAQVAELAQHTVAPQNLQFTNDSMLQKMIKG